MKKRKRIIIISIVFIIVLVVFSIFGIHMFKKHIIESGYGDSPNSANMYAENVTMIELITTPEKYDGKLVRVKGVGNLEFEENCIYLSKEDRKYGTDNCIWIGLGKRATPYEEAIKYNGEYVILEGIFDKDDCGHMNMFCGSIKNISRYELWNVHQTTSVAITQELDKTYSYEITDYSGRVLISDKGLTRQPKKEYVSTDVVGISVQTGTGLSTNFAIYCDLENSLVSETFSYVLGTLNNYVIYANYDSESGKHSITVQDIFDRSVYFETHELEDASATAEVAVDYAINEDGNVVITYLKGENLTETDITIVMP